MQEGLNPSQNEQSPNHQSSNDSLTKHQNGGIFGGYQKKSSKFWRILEDTMGLKQKTTNPWSFHRGFETKRPSSPSPDKERSQGRSTCQSRAHVNVQTYILYIIIIILNKIKKIIIINNNNNSNNNNNNLYIYIYNYLYIYIYSYWYDGKIRDWA